MYINKNKDKISNKHYAPAVREWNDAVYNFNGNYTSNSTTQYKVLNNLFKSYFNISNNAKYGRSKRMRYLRVKLNSKKFYLSSPEIKQNNDNVNITVYYLDREKQVLTRKLFFFNKRKLYNKFMLTKKKKDRKNINNNINKQMSSNGIKFIKELKTFRNKYKLKNIKTLQGIWFQLVKYILSMFNIQLYIPSFSSLLMKRKGGKAYIYSKAKLKKKNQKKIMSIVESDPSVLYWINVNTLSIDKIEKQDINYGFLKRKYSYEKRLYIDNGQDFSYEINNKLKIIVKTFILNNVLDRLTLNKLFNHLSSRLAKFGIRQIYNKKYHKMLRLIKIYGYNFLKLRKLLPILKMQIDNIYNKKVHLNLVNIKHFYLNSDIYSQILALKIQKRISSIKVLKKSISKIKLLSGADNITSDYKLNNNLVLRSVEYNNESSDKLDSLFSKLYPVNFTNNVKRNFIINNLKYKSVTGVRVENKGRLTRRNTAARSLLNTVFKGSLKDTDKYFDIQENRIKSISPVIIRNNIRSNTEYTSKASKRRIGSFGLKTWISAK